MQQAERQPPGYLQRVLRDGARGPLARASAHQLLGHPLGVTGDFGQVDRAAELPPAAFPYARSFAPSADTAPAAADVGHTAATPTPPHLETPIAGSRSTALDHSLRVTGDFGQVDRAAELPPAAFPYARSFAPSADTAPAAADVGHAAAAPTRQRLLEASIAGPRITTRVPDAAVPTTEVTIGDAAVTGKPRVTDTAPLPTPNSSAPVRVAAHTAAMNAPAPPTKTAVAAPVSVQPTSARTPAIEWSQAAAPARPRGTATKAGHPGTDATFADVQVDPEKLPPAIRALLPMLGRICRADSDSDPRLLERESSARAQTTIAVPARADRPSTRPVSEPPMAALAPGRGENHTIRRFSKREDDADVALRPAVSPLPRARVAMPHTPVPSVGAVPPIRQLRQVVETLVAKALGARRSAAEVPAPMERAVTQRPPQTIEHVVTTRVIHQPRPLRAFCERRYLGRPHMRAFR